MSGEGWFSRIAFCPCAVLVCITALSAGVAEGATILPVGPERDQWSDLAYPNTDSGSYTSGTGVLTITTQEFNDLELGNQFGPSNIGRHYGTGGTLGGPVQTTLFVNNVVIQPTADDLNTVFDESKYGTVTNGGSVLVRYDGSAPGSVGDDYGIPVASVLLQGTVIEALLDANGDNTLDLLVAIPPLGGGHLQNPNPDLGINFAPANLAVLRITRAAGLPSDWTQSFTLTGAGIDVLGVPEPAAVVLGLMGCALALFGRPKQNSNQRV